MDLNLSISWTQYAQAVIGLFALVNPFSTIPTFLGLTDQYSQAERRKIAAKTALATAVILGVAYLLGTGILWFFHISVASFRIAGGILIGMVALSMVQDRAQKTPKSSDAAALPIVPLALPLMAGPGSISMMIIVSSRTQTFVDQLAMVVALVAISLSIWVILSLATHLSRAVGPTGMSILTRVMGLILMAISVEFIVNGLMEKFPGWLG